MKILLVIFCLITSSFCNDTFAQLSLHFSTGINSSDIALNEKSDIPFGSITDRISGYFVEAGAGYQLTKKINFVFSTQLSQKGFSYNKRSMDKSSNRFSYLDFMPELEFRFFKVFDLGLGANFGLKFHEANRLTEDDEWIDSNFPLANNTDLGIIGKLKLNIKNFYLFTRINRGTKGLADITFISDDGFELNTTTTFNKNIQYGLGYRLIL